MSLSTNVCVCVSVCPGTHDPIELCCVHGRLQGNNMEHCVELCPESIILTRGETLCGMLREGETMSCVCVCVCELLPGAV